MGRDSIFGTIISRNDVEQGVLAHLKRWLPTYIASVERAEGLEPQTIDLPPDSVNSWRGGIDFDTVTQEWMPQLIVAVTPAGEPERYAGGEYAQDFQIQVAALVVGGDEDEARYLADYYGTSILGAMLQHGSLSTDFITKTVLVTYPTLSFPNDTERRFVQSLTTFHSIVESVISESAGPVDPPANPYLPPHDLGTVIETDTDVIGMP